MPILAAEPDLYPADLFESCGDRRAWAVAQTKPRQEKCLARDLLGQEIPFFAPCTPRRIRIRNRIAVSYNPLFAGYVFVRCESGERGRVLGTNRVTRLLAVGDQERLTDDLRQVWALTGLGLPLTTVERLDIGEKVRVRTGPMTGLTGSVVRSAGRQRFVVAVDFLGKGVAVELETGTLAKLPVAVPA